MKKIVALVALLAAFAATNLLVADPVPPIPEGTKVVAVMNMAKLRATQMYQDMKNKHLRQIRMMQDAVYLKTGIEMEDVETFCIMAVKEGQGVVVMKGSFDIDRIIGTVNASPEIEVQEIANTRFAVLLPDDKCPGQKNLAVILDDKTVAAGNVEFVKTFVAAYCGNSPALAGESLDYVNQNCTGSAIFQAVLISVDSEDIMKAPFLATVKRGMISMDVVGKSISMEAKVKAATPQDAEALGKILTGFSTLAKATQEQQNAAAASSNRPRLGNGLIGKALMDNLKISSVENDLVVGTSIPEDEVISMINKHSQTP
jgi:hypothetical protein